MSIVNNVLRGFIREGIIVPVKDMKVILIDYLGRECGRGVISDISSDGLPIVNGVVIEGTWVPDIAHELTFTMCQRHTGSYKYP